MSPVTREFDFSSLSADERTLLAHQLWDSVRQEAAAGLLSDEQLAECEKRLADYDKGAIQTLSLDEVKANLEKRRKNGAQG